MKARLLFPLFVISWTVGNAQQGQMIEGVCTQRYVDAAYFTRDLEAVKRLKLTSIRTEFQWKDIELEKGVLTMPPAYDQIVNESNAAGIQLLLILDYGNKYYANGEKPTSPEAIEAFCRYASFVVSHFKGKVRMYEVWNEWNNQSGGGRAGDGYTYSALLKAVYPQLKAIDQSLIIMGGSISYGGLHGEFLNQMLAAGSLSSMDGLSIHPYVSLDRDPQKRTPEAWATLVSETEQVLRKAGAEPDLPIYITEVNWPTGGPNGVNQTEQASYIQEMFKLAKRMTYVKGIWIFQLRDWHGSKSDTESNWGILTRDNEPKKVAGELPKRKQ